MLARLRLVEGRKRTVGYSRRCSFDWMLGKKKNPTGVTQSGINSPKPFAKLIISWKPTFPLSAPVLPAAEVGVIQGRPSAAQKEGTSENALIVFNLRQKWSTNLMCELSTFHMMDWICGKISESLDSRMDFSFVSTSMCTKGDWGQKKSKFCILSWNLWVEWRQKTDNW